MKKIVSLFLFTMSFMTFNSLATVIGDTATIHRAYPDIYTNFVSPVSTVVTDDSSDAVMVQSHALININSATITIDYKNSSGFGGADGRTFDGYIFRGFSFPITQANLIRSDIQTTHVTFDQDNIYIDISGGFSAGDKIIVSFEVASPARSALINIDNLTPDIAIPSEGGLVNFDKSLQNLGGTAATYEMYVHLVFPNGQIRTLDTPQLYKIQPQQQKMSQGFGVEVKPWFPQGQYSVVYTAIDTFNGQFYTDSDIFLKQ
ncbi:hypothetical protein L1077_05240 [Pseudoalteromonas luteoviolacea]|uniref:hypothetical protein n=1 Tax=Pseudoalteromonas luteoviolacea TaxID=43657 RepID=UPI001F46B309|nr:hypothetical protein [Pseudoalteromonas luteoviolacea]MCF6438834.1 hypothetical protein [Pseudoalteromonas luteoviolacea]